MSAITPFARPRLPSAADPVPMLSSRELHSRLLRGGASSPSRELSPADLPALRDYLAEARRAAAPATPEQAIACIARLQLHYPVSEMSESAQALRMQDWLDDLVDVPLDVLQAACDMWRRSNERFMPSPGNLLALVGEDRQKGREHWGRYRAKIVAIAEAAIADLQPRAGARQLSLRQDG